MRARLSVFVLSLILLGGGCAPSVMIRGTLATRTPAESAVPSPEADSGRVALGSSIRDAVIYVEPLHPRGEASASPPRSLYRVELKAQEFSPRIIVVPVGSSVDFTNNDSVFHNAFSVSPAKPFDLGRRGGGKTRRVTFEKPGLVKVYCTIHSNMAAYVLVVPNGTFARPDSSGRFVLPPLPKGKYVVNVWHPDFKAIRREVTIDGGENPDVVVTLGP